MLPGDQLQETPVMFREQASDPVPEDGSVLIGPVGWTGLGVCGLCPLGPG